MSKEEMEAFLSGGAPTADPAPEPQPAPVDSKPEAAPEPVAAETKPPADDDDDGEPDAPAEGEAIIPRRAYETERRKRQDWKERAVRHETEAAELRKQLEAFKQAPPPPPPQPQQMQPPPVLDPMQDPQGFHRHTQLALLNAHLNQSELLMRTAIGKDKLQDYVNEFQQAAQQDPGLMQKLYGQQHPYEWLTEEVEGMRLRREVGNDPKAYRDRLRAEFEAEFNARGNVQQLEQPRISPVAGQAPSLANVRSSAPRSAPAFTGPPSLDDILAQRPQRASRR